MKLAFFDTKKYDKTSFAPFFKKNDEVNYITSRLKKESLFRAKGAEGVVVFVNDDGSRDILQKLAKMGIKYWFQRSAGYDNVDLKAAREFDIKVYRVPDYSPEAVSEFAWTTMTAINRNIQVAYWKTSHKDFSLNGLQGETIHGSTVGVMGVGRIGQTFIKIAKGFGTNVIVYDNYAKENNADIAKEMGFKFVDKETLFKESDYISLHLPLMPSTKYIINKQALSMMKKEVIIVNTSRGGLIDTEALLEAMDHGLIRGAGLDVYENEKGVFFYDHSNDLIPDPILNRLRAHRNVILTSHQAWFTNLALCQIAETTMHNVHAAKNNDCSQALSISKDGKVING